MSIPKSKHHNTLQEKVLKYLFSVFTVKTIKSTRKMLIEKQLRDKFTGVIQK